MFTLNFNVLAYLAQKLFWPSLLYSRTEPQQTLVSAFLSKAVKPDTFFAFLFS